MTNQLSASVPFGIGTTTPLALCRLFILLTLTHQCIAILNGISKLNPRFVSFFLNTKFAQLAYWKYSKQIQC
jgi:hypothetical protein